LRRVSPTASSGT